MTEEAGCALRRAIRAQLDGFAGLIEIEEVGQRPWASVTFAGAQHVVRLSLGGECAHDAAGRFLHGLGEREFDLRGHILVDIAVSADLRQERAVTLTLEALTIEAD